MKETDHQRIERHLEEFAAWRASGLPLQTYAEQRGESLSLWRGRLAWEQRWQQMLAGTYQKPAIPKPAPTPAAFVQAVAQPSIAASQSRAAQRISQRTTQPTLQDCAHDHICIVVSSPGRSDLQANIHWPIDQMDMSGQWLREVLA